MTGFFTREYYLRNKRLLALVVYLCRHLLLKRKV